MLSVVVGFLLHFGGQGSGPAPFLNRLKSIQPHWSYGTVVQVLGPPDYIRHHLNEDGSLKDDDNILCYGTLLDGKTPALGSVLLKEDGVASVFIGPGESSPESIVSPPELHIATELFDKISKRETEPVNSHDLIRAANLLIDKGQDKALAILDEYSQEKSVLWLYWLVRVAFTSKSAGGVFELPAVGAIQPFPPKDLKTWPTYPIAIVDDVPFPVYTGIAMGGAPGRFRSYLLQNQENWLIRPERLTPPNDPFQAFKKLVALPIWPFPASGQFGDDCWCGGKMVALKQVLDLIHTSYVPGREPVELLNFDKIHDAFLAIGCHWDAAKQEYVRKDGSVLAEY